MNNYDKMISDACRRFTSYDMALIAERPGVEDLGESLKTCFLENPFSCARKMAILPWAVQRRILAKPYPSWIGFATENRMQKRRENTVRSAAFPAFTWEAADL